MTVLTDLGNRYMWNREEFFRVKVITLLILANAILFSYFDKTPDYKGSFKSFFIAAILTLAAWYYRSIRNEPKIACALHATAHYIVFTLVAAIFNHLLILFQRPLIDETLVKWDAALGFNWPAFIAKAQSIPLLDTLSTFAYQTSLPQLAIVFIVLAFSGREQRLNNILKAFILAAVSAILFWAVFPSFGSYVYYVINGSTLDMPGLIVDLKEVNAILSLRAGEWQVLDVSKLTGLIAFPSFHTVMAVFSIYAMRGVRFLFIPTLLLNILVLISVPIDGGHHLVDLISGVALALAAIGYVEGWFQATTKKLHGIKQTAADPTLTIPQTHLQKRDEN